MSFRGCPICQNMLKLKLDAVDGTKWICLRCGYNKEFKPTSSEEALVLETTFAEKGASAKQVHSVLNDFTLLDPTMPHLKTVGCPNTECPTRADPSKRDVLYIKTDAVNLKYQYCCMICKTQWAS